MEFVSFYNPSFLVRQNRPILELWASGRTHARTHGHIFEKCVFQISFHGRNQKNGVGKNSRAFCLARTESIPAVYFLAPVGAVQPEKYDACEFHKKMPSPQNAPPPSNAAPLQQNIMGRGNFLELRTLSVS